MSHIIRILKSFIAAFWSLADDVGPLAVGLCDPETQVQYARVVTALNMSDWDELRWAVRDLRTQVQVRCLLAVKAEREVTAGTAHAVAEYMVALEQVLAPVARLAERKREAARAVVRAEEEEDF